MEGERRQRRRRGEGWTRKEKARVGSPVDSNRGGGHERGEGGGEWERWRKNIWVLLSRFFPL